MCSPRIVENDKVVEILSKVYSGAKRKSLKVNFGKDDSWIIREIFPSLGDCSLLIRDLKREKIIMSFLEFLSVYYKGNKEMVFYYIQEEYMDKNQSLSYQFDYTNIKKLADYYARISHLNSILLNSDFSWVLKLHYEGFGLLKGDESFLNAIKMSSLAEFIEETVWN